MTDSEDRRSALILYGTETGTSLDLAEEVGRSLERLHFRTDIVGLDAVRLTHFNHYTFTVIVIATTGQGDFPENARNFWTSLLRRKLSPTTLAGVDYALVGLGDSSYPKFNWAARKLEKRLRQLGASELLDSCEADEQGDEGIEGTFLAWLQLFREKILNDFPLAQGQVPIPDDVPLPSRWRLERSSQGLNGDHSSPAVNGFHSPSVHEEDSLESFSVVLDVNDRVTPKDHWQDVRCMSLRASRWIDYMPGDAIAISPRNMPADVASLISRMSWQDVADTPIQLVLSQAQITTFPYHLSTIPILNHPTLTLRCFLTNHLDINAIPRRSFLGHIANYTDDSMHKERLLEFTDPQYLDEYFDYATRPRRSILEILQEFDSVHLPWEEVTNIFPLMRPRQFSIASGGALKTGLDGTTKFELLLAIVKYKTVIKRIREGVCTRYLAHLPVATELRVSLKTEGRFSPKPDPSSEAHILIGAGTGIAPLRALIHEKLNRETSSPPGKTLLFFGCRNEKSDYFFQDEWKTLSARWPNALEIIPAFSRDQTRKVYVQDRIRERSELVWEFLREREATVIVCGAAGLMPKAVRQALSDVLVQQAERRRRKERDLASGGRGKVDDENEDGDENGDEEPIANHEDAERYLTRLEKIGRYKQETWS